MWVNVCFPPFLLVRYGEKFLEVSRILKLLYHGGTADPDGLKMARSLTFCRTTGFFTAFFRRVLWSTATKLIRPHCGLKCRQKAHCRFGLPASLFSHCIFAMRTDVNNFENFVF